MGRVRAGSRGEAIYLGWCLWKRALIHQHLYLPTFPLSDIPWHMTRLVILPWDQASGATGSWLNTFMFQWKTWVPFQGAGCDGEEKSEGIRMWPPWKGREYREERLRKRKCGGLAKVFSISLGQQSKRHTISSLLAYYGFNMCIETKVTK